MLLDVQDYVDLVKRADIPKSKGTLLCYILDETESTTDLISRLASETGLVPSAEIHVWKIGAHLWQSVSSRR